VADSARIEDLRRRVQKDPASIAFAQLAEEYRRAGQSEQAVEVCRRGLSIHPGYLSARVTLGRALLDLGDLGEAQRELELVLKSAPENLAALRGLAEVHHRRGDLSEALSQYKTAATLARNDPDLAQTVDDLTRLVKPSKRTEPDDGLSLEQMQRELAAHAPAPVKPRPAHGDATSAVAPAGAPVGTPGVTALPDTPRPSTSSRHGQAPRPQRPDADVPTRPAALDVHSPEGADSSAQQSSNRARSEQPAKHQHVESSQDVESFVIPAALESLDNVASLETAGSLAKVAGPGNSENPVHLTALATITALERWLDALHGQRSSRHP
jgi:tetratricopeptide (TPR) repeat protein